MQTHHSRRRSTGRAATAAREAAVQKARQRQDASALVLNGLPSELGRHRILNTDVAAAFWGVSVPHWRRLYRAKKVPSPIKIGERKLGWRVGVLAEALAKRNEEAS